MTSMAVILSVVLVVLAVAQIPLVCIFLRVLRGTAGFPSHDSIPPDHFPQAAMILCLRGPDPFLSDTLKAATAQNYPGYRLFVIIDHPDDPAWETVEESFEGRIPEHVTLVQLDKRRDTCSLKCSSLVQIIEELDPSFEIVALLDADTVPHPTWLAELAAPLTDPTVGATTGNRWYAPRQATWGALVRYLWNAAAVVQMFCYGIPWGGTLAVKLSVVRQNALLHRWSHGFCEDTMLFTELKRSGQRVVFVPTLMMLNQESCQLSGFFHWVRRQLLTARLYHPGWPAVVLHGLLTSLALLAGMIGLVVFSLGASLPETILLAASLLLYLTVMQGMLIVLERQMRRICITRDADSDWLNGRTRLRLFLAILPTQFVYAAALISVLFVRRIGWRGITYQIDGPRDIRMIEYRPFQSGPANVARGTSL